MKKIITFILCACLLLSVLTGCSSPADTTSAQKETAGESTVGTQTTTSGDDPAFPVFDQPVEVHIAMEVDPTSTDTLLDGDTAEDNYYTRYYLENFNIKS
jgi:hypothetical protein